MFYGMTSRGSFISCTNASCHLQDKWASFWEKCCYDIKKIMSLFKLSWSLLCCTGEPSINHVCVNGRCLTWMMCWCSTRTSSTHVWRTACWLTRTSSRLSTSLWWSASPSPTLCRYFPQFVSVVEWNYLCIGACMCLNWLCGTSVNCYQHVFICGFTSLVFVEERKTAILLLLFWSFSHFAS